MEIKSQVADSLSRWKRGDESGANELVHYLYPILSKIVANYFISHVAPEDLIQEILLKIFTRVDEFKNQVPLEHWAARIARNTCIDKWRSQKIRPEVRWIDLSPGEQEIANNLSYSLITSSPPSLSESVMARDMVARLLATLSPEDRHLIVLVDMEGFSLSEVAEEKGWGLSKIKMRLSRIRASLRETINRWETPS